MCSTTLQRMQGSMGQIRQGNWCKHVPESVETSLESKVTILWNQEMKTDRTIPNYKLDIVIHDNETGTCLLIDIAISGDIN